MRSACPDGTWTLHEHPVVTSTNLVAGKLPAWNAVRADIQTQGRGRFQRAWVSDKGGLWLSAVVPLGPDPLQRRALPLAAGLAVCETLNELGISGFRLRWPNDVLVGNKKLAGLLIDQFVAGLAVIGIGINVTNRPEATDPQLVNLVARMADLLSKPPDLASLTIRVLRHLRSTLLALETQGTSALFLRVNQLWLPPRTVELDLDGKLASGVFHGIDSQG
ncbi:MAG TPA: biotin--[acetyl-CoA-carboxylase] ligase, partial [Verrucomicrobiae bacterium]|nr:biotin--[acetyl-CoA-carboxylase] ligase [Verrucomicrobiae bacterium]